MLRGSEHLYGLKGYSVEDTVDKLSLDIDDYKKIRYDFYNSNL